MEYTVYEVCAERKVISLDIDGVPYEDYERVFDDLFSSKVNAIRKSQQLFDRREADWVVVTRVSITEKGMRRGKKSIYRKFRR